MGQANCKFGDCRTKSLKLKNDDNQRAEFCGIHTCQYITRRDARCVNMIQNNDIQTCLKHTCMTNGCTNPCSNSTHKPTAYCYKHHMG